MEGLDHIHDTLHAGAIYMNAIFPSAGYDTGYDVTNHTAIDPIFGTMEQFVRLLEAVHDKCTSLEVFSLLS